MRSGRVNADELYIELLDAMETHEPACRGVDLYTQDDPKPADLRVCAPICDACPLKPECAAYAEAANPAAGIWAGKTYGRKTRVLRKP